MTRSARLGAITRAKARDYIWDQRRSKCSRGLQPALGYEGHMDKLRVTGGTPLHGSVHISGAKNSALPAMAASLLTADEVTLENLPLVNDIFTMRRLLRDIAEGRVLGDTTTLADSTVVDTLKAQYEEKEA